MEAASVLHIASWFPMPRDKRLGNFVEEHLKAIHPLLEVVVLSAFEHHSDEVIIKYEPFLQVQVLYRKKWPLISHYQALKKGYNILLARGHRFNLAHLHVCWPSGIAFLGFLRKMPFIITEHYSGYQKSRRAEWSSLAQVMARRVFNRAQVVCPVSDQLKASFKEFGVHSLQKTIGNTVNDQIFKYRSPQKKAHFKLLHISSLQEETKNITGILNAFEGALQKDKSLFLSIGGDGDTRKLAAQIAERNIPAENIEILNALSKEEVADQMAASDAFLLFSFIENQPVVLLESLCLGRPVIASKVGGIPEFVNAENGLLVKPKDEDALIRAILEMKANYDSYELPAISSASLKNYAYEAIGLKFLEVYTSVRPLKS